MSAPTSVVHLAGIDVQYETHLRQRCSWCGAMLLDVELSQIAVPVGQDSKYPSWAIGSFVEQWSPDNEGGVQQVVEVVDGKAPENSCFRMSPELTA